MENEQQQNRLSFYLKSGEEPKYVFELHTEAWNEQSPDMKMVNLEALKRFIFNEEEKLKS